MNMLLDEHGVMQTDETSILKELQCFYNALFTALDSSIKSTHMREEILKYTCQSIDLDTQSLMKVMPTIQEAIDMLMLCPKDKSPRIDKLTCEVFVAY